MLPTIKYNIYNNIKNGWTHIYVKLLICGIKEELKSHFLFHKKSTRNSDTTLSYDELNSRGNCFVSQQTGTREPAFQDFVLSF